MVKTRINAGICGFSSEIEASSEDSRNVSITIKTECGNIKNLAKKITTVDAYNEIKEGFNGELYKTMSGELKGCCAGCIVPSGIFKSMQVAAKLALPKEMKIEIEK